MAGPAVRPRVVSPVGPGALGRREVVLLDRNGFRWSRWPLLLSAGLRCACRVEVLDGGLIAVALSPDEGQPELRSAERRGFPLHVSLAFESEAAPEDVEALRERWGGRTHTFRFCRVGWGGGAELAADDELRLDPAARRMKERGWYSDRPFHISL